MNRAGSGAHGGPAPLTRDGIECLVEEAIAANAAWSIDPLSSQVDAVMAVIDQALEQAWDAGAICRAQADPATTVYDLNPHRPRRTP